MDYIFGAVYSLLTILSSITGLTYEQVNIIVYYVGLPFMYIALIDKILKKHHLKILFIFCVVIFFIIIKDFYSFSNRLFDMSVNFLMGFQKIGLNYIVASVVICVVLPLVVFLALYHFAFKDDPKNRFIIFTMEMPFFKRIWTFIYKKINKSETEP